MFLTFNSKAMKILYGSVMNSELPHFAIFPLSQHYKLNIDVPDYVQSGIIQPFFLRTH